MSETAVVEQAKGVLMLRYAVCSYEALGVLERWSHETGEPLRAVAQAITHGICQGRHGHTDGSAHLVRWLEQRFREELFTPTTRTTATAHAEVCAS